MAEATMGSHPWRLLKFLWFQVKMLTVDGQEIAVSLDELVAHLDDGIDVQLGAGVGIQHGGQVDVLLLAGAGGLDGHELAVEVEYVPHCKTESTGRHGQAKMLLCDLVITYSDSVCGQTYGRSIETFS